LNRFGNTEERRTPDIFSVDTPHELCDTYVALPQEENVVQSKLDLLQGTLDLMVLRTLSALGPLHGYGIARRIEQVSGDAVLLNQGTIYASLVRIQQKRWIRAEWGVSENNRRAKYYSITKAGEKQLRAGTETWERIAAVMGRVLAIDPKGGE
jgi:transcriptional regulator